MQLGGLPGSGAGFAFDAEFVGHYLIVVLCLMLAWLFSLKPEKLGSHSVLLPEMIRVPAPSNHILSHILTYATTFKIFPNPQYRITGSFGPLG